MTNLEMAIKKELEEKNFKIADLEQYIRDLEDEISHLDKRLRSNSKTSFGTSTIM